MKNIFKNIILAIFVILSFNSCSTYKSIYHKEYGDIEKARMKILVDFAKSYRTPKNQLKDRKGKPFTIFRVFDREINDEIYVFGVSPEPHNFIALSHTDSLGKVPNSYFPNRYAIIDKNLFLWRDNITPLSKEILNVIQEFGVLDSTDVKKNLGLLPTDFEDERLIILDDKLKGVDYYICKNNINKFKKIKTSIAYGYYKPPKLKCK